MDHPCGGIAASCVPDFCADFVQVVGEPLRVAGEAGQVQLLRLGHLTFESCDARFLFQHGLQVTGSALSLWLLAALRPSEAGFLKGTL